MTPSPKTLSRVAEALKRVEQPCGYVSDNLSDEESILCAQAAIAEFLQCEEMKKVEEALAVAESTIQAYQRIQRVPDGWVTKLIRDALAPFLPEEIK